MESMKLLLYLVTFPEIIIMGCSPSLVGVGSLALRLEEEDANSLKKASLFYP